MTVLPAVGGRALGRAEPGLILRQDLVGALNRAAQKQVTIISAPAGSGKTSLLRAWAARPGRDYRVAFMTVRPGQHDMQLFWLALLGAIRAAAGTGDDGAQLPPVAPGGSGSAMVDKVLSELEQSGDRLVLVIDDLHELSAAEAAGQLTTLLTRLPAGVRAIVATRRDLPLRLHRLRLAGDLAEIRAAELRFTEDETRQVPSDGRQRDGDHRGVDPRHRRPQDHRCEHPPALRGAVPKQFTRPAPRIRCHEPGLHPGPGSITRHCRFQLAAS